MKLIDRTDEVKEKLDKALENALKQIGITGAGAVKANAPVLTGNLRRAYKYQVDKENLEVSIGVSDATAKYATAVEFKPVNKGGRPHLRSSLDAERENFRKIVETELKGVK